MAWFCLRITVAMGIFFVVDKIFGLSMKGAFGVAEVFLAVLIVCGYDIVQWWRREKRAQRERSMAKPPL